MGTTSKWWYLAGRTSLDRVKGCLKCGADLQFKYDAEGRTRVLLCTQQPRCDYRTEIPVDGRLRSLGPDVAPRLL